MKFFRNAVRLGIHAARAIVFGALLLLFVVVGAASLAGFFSNYCTPFELASHFRVVYVVVFLAAAITFVLLKQKWAAVTAATLVVINLAPVVYLNVPISIAQGDQGGKPEDLNVLQFNLQGMKNQNYNRTLKVIAKVDPDIVGLSEITPVWGRVLEKNLTKYPYRVVEPHQGGVSLFSKFPIVESKVKYFGSMKRPRVVAQVDVDGQKLDIVFIHPVTPLKARYLRNRELVDVATDAKNFKNPGIVFGDMNTTPWSGTFDKLLHDGGLLDSERGFGYQPTWNAKMRLSLLPIDHLLFTPEFSVRERRVLGRVGSDHLPVFVKLAYKRS